MSILSAHKGHAATITDDRTLRCQTCSHTLLLPLVATSTSRTPPKANSEDECPEHRGEYRDLCRCCAADRKGVRDEVSA